MKPKILKSRYMGLFDGSLGRDKHPGFCITIQYEPAALESIFENRYTKWSEDKSLLYVFDCHDVTSRVFIALICFTYNESPKESDTIESINHLIILENIDLGVPFIRGILGVD